MPPLSLFIALYAPPVPDRRSPPVAAPEKKPRDLQLADNRKALFDYSIEERFEAGVVLTGTEIKSLRAGHVNLRDGYAHVEIGLARGKKRYEKRQVIKEREAAREMQAAVKRRV
jgi:tmRNA-binding protein